MPNNPYLDMENRRTAGEAPEGAANNQYLSLADRLESAAVIRQQTTINKALMSNPEIEAEKRRLAGQLNLPPVAVDGLGMDEAKRRAALQQVQQNAANAPVLGRSLARDNFARLAIDDTSPLARIETALKDPVFRQGRAILEAQQRAIGGTLDAFRALQRPGALLKSLLAGTADLAAAAPGVARAGLEVAESYSRSAMPLIFSEKLTPEQIAQIRGERISAEKPFDPNAPLAVAAETARAGQEALRATGTRLMPTARTKGEEMVFGGVRSAGSSLGALLAGALTRSPGLAMEIMGSTAGAESYARGREKGLEPIEAAVYGWTSRNIEKVTELIPVKGLIDNLDAKTPLGTMLLDQLAREIPTEQAATVLGDLNDWVMTNPEGTLQEYLAERPSRALETLVSTVVATGLQTTIVKGADMARESLIQRVQQEKEVNQITTEGQLAVVEALMGEAANSKLAARDRDELQAFVDEAAADSPVTSIYIAPETLAQTAMDLNLDVRVVAEQLGVADQLMSSAQTGADIQLSVGAFIAKVSGTDLAAPLMNVIKTDPFLYSRAEMAQLKETGYANEVAEAEELVRTVLTDESFRASADVVRSQVTEQLQAMGRFTGDINTVYASATAQAYLTLAKRLNITPEEALARAPLKIRGQTITGQTLDVPLAATDARMTSQAQGYAGQDIGEAQEWVRARAKGLDMSQPARMERARAMGFDVDTQMYHRTSATFEAFRIDDNGPSGPVIFLGRDPQNLQQMHNRKDNGDRIIPVYSRRKSPLLLDEFNLKEMQDRWAGGSKEFPFYVSPEVKKRLEDAGYDSIEVDDVYGDGSVNEVVIFNPSDIRSNFAAFDPDFSESANILAQAQAEGYAGQDIGEAQEWVRARAKGLDMSQPARMERAKAMGFDTETVLYHGAVVWPTTAKPGTAPLGDVSAFDRLASTRTRKPSLDTLGVFLSDNPGNTGAGMYAGRGLEMDQPLRPAPVMYPLVVRANKTYATTFNEMARKAAELNNERGRPTNMEPYRKWLTSQGFDSVSFAKEPGEFADQNVLVVLDEANIRSVNAAFDPDFSESANILAQAQAEGYAGQDTGEAQEWVRARAKGLDMSQSARMERAKAMGFDTETVLYHGTTYAFDEFTGLTFLTEDPEEGSAYGNLGLRERERLDAAETAARTRIFDPGDIEGQSLPYTGIFSDVPPDQRTQLWATDQGIGTWIDGNLHVAKGYTVEYETPAPEGYGYILARKLRPNEQDPAEEYFKERVDYAREKVPTDIGPTNVVMPVYARRGKYKQIDNPFEANILGKRLQVDLDKTGRARLDQLLADVEQWKQEGYIGIDTMSDEGAILGTPIRQKIVFNPSDIRSVNAAFDPDFSESANILAQTVNAPRQLEDNPVAFGLTPEQAKKVNPIYNPKTLPVERLPSNQEAALWLEGNYIGDPVTDLTAELSDEQIKEIATIMAAEAQLALGNTGNAFTWYSSALAKALDIISIKYPMLADDAAAAEAGLGTSRNARFAFTYIMAVTSQNLDVAANSVATDKAFGDMLKRVANGNFTMPRSWGTGDKQKAMGENFAKFGPLIDKMPGDDFPSKLAALDDLFRVKMTVKEWVAYMKQQGVPYNKPGQTAMDAVVYGSSLLGPKIGNGFWQNLNGNYDPMTIDLWMRRTWGRLTGKSIGNPAALPEQRARLAGAIKRSRSREQGKPDHIAAMAAKIAATEKQLNGLKQADFASKKEFTAEEKRLKAEIKDNQEALADLANLKAPETWSAEYNTSNDALLAYAKRLLKAWNVEYERLKEGSKSGTVPAEAQPTWARAAKTIITNLAKPLDQVANGTQRKQIERAGKEALRILQERGITLTTADLQAILWYPEKELWGSLTAELETDEDGDPVVPPSSLNESYDTAFSRILKEQGYEIQGIAGDGGGGLGAGAVARQDGGPQQPASSGRVGAPGGAIAERGPDTLGQEQISGRRPQQLGARDGRRAYSSGGLAPLEGSPAKTAGPDPSLVTVAEDYAAENGIPLRRPARFAELDVDRAQRIAAAFDAMQHAPNDPAVREAYENLKRQTRAQYDALIAAGYVFTFYDGDTDPYAGNPMNAMRDLRNNKRMAVYGTYSGYGTEGVTEGDRADNPMLEDAGLKWPDQNGAMQPVTANDLFRAVHDAFGHGLEAAGFRARGEENAWQAHMRLYTGSAVGAATTELRGQNSWLNYGPYGETNRTAKVEDTVFAENKIGLMPEWTWTEGRVEDMPEQPDTLGQAKRNLDALGFYSAVQESAKLIPDNVWKMGWPAARSALAKGGAGIAPRKTELQYLNLDAMFGDTKLRGQALKEAVEEHIAANRLSLVENFARFDPNAKAPTKAEMLDQLSDWSLSNILNVRTINFGQNKGRIIAALLNRESEFQTGLFVEVGENEERVIDNRKYKLYRTLDNGQQELLFTGQLADIRRYAARVLVNENKALVLRNVTKDELEYYWEDERVEMGGLVRGPGDIRLPGEDVPLFEAVIGIPEGVPGADYRAPISHVGGKAKGTLVTAHGEERIDDKGQRTIFVGQVQSDMAQGKREEKKDLEASAKALRVLENNPNANRFLYTEGQIRVASAEDAADVPYAAILLSRDQVKEMYKTEGARIETPLITTSEWTNVAVRAMIYRAAREGFESISFPTGETSTMIQTNDAAAQHYETNVKGALEKLAKQLGGEVRRGYVTYTGDMPDIPNTDGNGGRYRVFYVEGDQEVDGSRRYGSRREAEKVAQDIYEAFGDKTYVSLGPSGPDTSTASAYIFDLNRAMRKKIVSEGFPLFQERRGEYAPALNEIRINAQADLSTYIHELGHHFLEVYNNVALELVASQVGGQDLAEQEQVLVDDTRRLITEIARQTNTPIDGDALTWWNGLTFQQRVPMHEQFARLTEAYFMTGEAPTPELKDIFSTIRRWMLQVYKSLTELNVELSDEVKEVMGRMYAAQDDIATAERNRGLNRLFSVKPDYMSDQEWQAYQQIAAQATSDAEDELSARSVRDVQWLANARSRELRKLQRANADKRNLMKAEVSLEVMQMPVNRARSFLKRGVGPNDEPVTGPHKLSIAIMESRYPQQADTDPARRWKKLGYGQYGMLAETGLDPDTVAELTGFPSGDALIEALLTAERASTVIEAETDRRMLERYGDLSDEQKMSQAADEAVHNGLRARVLQAEYAALSKAAKRTRPLVMAAKEIAQAQVAKMQASKLNANKFIAAERAAGKKAEAALRKNDLTGAATAKRDQLLNFEIAREIQRVIKQRDRMLTLFKTIVTAKRDTVSKTRNYDLVQASRAVLSAYGFGRVKNDVNSYLEAIKVYDPTLYSNLAPTITNAVSRGMTMDQLSVEQFLGMGDVVKQLWDLSREEMVVEIDGRKLELAAVTQELGLKLESLGAAPKGASTEAASDWQKTLRQGEGLKSSLRRVEAWARLYDGTKVGPFTKYIWRTISTAADRYRADRNKYVQQFRDLFATIEGGMGGKKINAPEINYTFRTKSELLHAILHTGNGSNKRKLLLGRQWGEVDQDGALIDNRWQNLINRLAQEGVLTKADFDFAQGVWDLLEETKPLAQETHRKVFGLYFSEITAEEVQTPFGTYRGGYVPAVYDSYNVQDAALRAQQEQVEANDSTMFPAPASGFTKNRVEYNRELALDLMILPNHIDKVLKFSHMASPVRDVMKILKNKEFSALLEAIDPTAQSDVLLPWLTRAARQIVEEPTKGQGGPMVDGFFRAIRQRSGMGLMFANLVNVAQQVTGFSLAAIVVKPSYLARGLLRYTSNPQKITETIRQASMMMRERGDNQLSAMYGEIDKIIDKDDKYGQVKDWFGRHTYFMQQGVQNVMDVIVWLGAYDQALAAGETENEAAKQGDAAVRMTQGSTLPEDVSRIETGPAVLRSFTHMYSYFNMWGNLLSAEFRTTWRELGLKQGAGRLMFAYMAGLAIPTFFAQIIADGLRGKLPEDEDEDGWMDEWLSWAFMTSSKTALAFIPVAGQAGVATIGAFTNEPYDDRVGGSPAISAVEASVRTPASVYKAIAEDGDKSRAVKDTLTLMTTLTGLPFQVLGRPVGYAVDVAEGDITPTSGADYVRGLVTGAASEASR